MDHFIFLVWGILMGLLPQVITGGIAALVVVRLQEYGRLTRRWSNMLTTTGLMAAPWALWMVATDSAFYGLIMVQIFLITGSVLVGPILGFFLHRLWLSEQE